MEPIDQYYVEKNVLADDEKSIIRDDNLSFDGNDDDDDLSFDDDSKDKSLKDKLRSNIGKTIVKTLTGQELHFNRIKIDENLLKKNILKVRYINSNRKINDKFLKGDYQISNNMKNAILKNTNLNKLTKNEYDVYNTLQKYRKNDDNLQLLISSYLAGKK